MVFMVMVFNYSKIANSGFRKYSNILFGHFWNLQKIDQVWTLGPLRYHQNTCKKARTSKIMFKSYYFTYQQIMDFQNFGTCLKRRAPKNDEDPFNKILNILDMRSISIKTTKLKFGNMEPFFLRRSRL